MPRRPRRPPSGRPSTSWPPVRARLQRPPGDRDRAEPTSQAEQGVRGQVQRGQGEPGRPGSQAEKADGRVQLAEVPAGVAGGAAGGPPGAEAPAPAGTGPAARPAGGPAAAGRPGTGAAGRPPAPAGALERQMAQLQAQKRQLHQRRCSSGGRPSPSGRRSGPTSGPRPPSPLGWSGTGPGSGCSPGRWRGSAAWTRRRRRASAPGVPSPPPRRTWPRPSRPLRPRRRSCNR